MSTIAPPKGKYIPGDYWIICERSGQKAKRSDCRTEWTGRIVRKDLWELKQPQLDIRGRRDDIAVDDPRPRQTDVFNTNVTPDDL